MNPEDLFQFTPLLLEDKADMILGSRFLGKNWHSFKGGYLKYFFANKIITSFLNILWGAHLTDVNCGYKMFKSKIIKGLVLRSNSFEIEVEIIGALLKNGCRIKEVPVSYEPRGKMDGKKIRLKHAFLMIYQILKSRLIK